MIDHCSKRAGKGKYQVNLYEIVWGHIVSGIHMEAAANDKKHDQHCHCCKNPVAIDKGLIILETEKGFIAQQEGHEEEQKADTRECDRQHLCADRKAKGHIYFLASGIDDIPAHDQAISHAQSTQSVLKPFIDWYKLYFFIGEK